MLDFNYLTFREAWLLCLTMRSEKIYRVQWEAFHIYCWFIFIASLRAGRKRYCCVCFIENKNGGPGQVEAFPKNAQLVSENLFPAPLSPHLMSSCQGVLPFCGQQDISQSHIVWWKNSLALMETQNATSVGATPSDAIIAEITLFWNFCGSILRVFSLMVRVLEGSHTFL